MSYVSLVGPAVVAAVISALVSAVGILISTRTARKIHLEKLTFDREQSKRTTTAEIELANRKFDFDAQLSERKFNYDRLLHDHKRRLELAEQALIAFYEARHVLVWTRARGVFPGEGESRLGETSETERQRKKRNMYYVPIERLLNENALFARLQSLSYPFRAYFGDPSLAPFSAILEVRNQITNAAYILIEQELPGDLSGATLDKASLLNILGRGPRNRPDEIDTKVDQAVNEVEQICNPILVLKLQSQ